MKRVDSLGHPRSQLVVKRPPGSGESIRLTLDVSLQRAAQQALTYGIQLAQNNRAWILQEMGQKAGTAVPANAPAGATAEFYVNQSLQFYQAGRYAETIAAAREALKLKPDMVEAHNNIAAGYLGLQKWDEAIAAAMDALRIRPDYALAKNNLAFAVNQKRKQLEAASKKK